MPAGAGPDRSHRSYQDRGGGPFRGRGGSNNRGRGGGYSSYDGANMSSAYDQNPSQPYTDYEAPPPGPSAYFQSNNGYGDPSSYYNGASGYEGYDKYEGALQRLKSSTFQKPLPCQVSLGLSREAAEFEARGMWQSHLGAS